MAYPELIFCLGGRIFFLGGEGDWVTKKLYKTHKQFSYVYLVLIMLRKKNFGGGGGGSNPVNALDTALLKPPKMTSCRNEK